MPSSTTKRPNILFVFSDQQRWDTCGCYGQPLPVTPNLDRMAQEGVRFEHAFTCQPVCGPARAALQTGLYPTSVGCHTNHKLLPLDAITLPKLLKPHGYDTAYIGKWHLASYGKGEADNFRSKPVPTERRGGYDYWLASDCLEFTSHSYDGYMFDGEGNRREFPEGRFRADAVTDWTIEYLENRQSDKPFFLFLSFIEPHHQNDNNRYEGPHGSKEQWKDFPVPGDLEGTQGDWRANYPDYLGCCRSLDDNLGRLRQTLTKLGIADDTLIIYTSDHGSHFRTRNSEYKRACHEGCIRIPMVVCGPGFTGGRTVTDLVSLIDLPPTVLSAAGLTPPENWHGCSLQPLADGSCDCWREEIFLQISESQCGRAIRTSRWKYSVRAPEKGGGVPSSEIYAEDFLYDLDADPHEKNNLIQDPQHAQVREVLREKLKKRMVAAGEREPVIVPAG